MLHLLLLPVLLLPVLQVLEELGTLRELHTLHVLLLQGQLVLLFRLLHQVLLVLRLSLVFQLLHLVLLLLVSQTAPEVPLGRLPRFPVVLVALFLRVLLEHLLSGHGLPSGGTGLFSD